MTGIIAGFSLDNIEKAVYKFGGRVSITVTKDVHDEYAIEVNDGGVDLRYKSLPFKYHCGDRDTVFERGAGSPAGRWYVATGDEYHYIDECERHTKARTEFVLGCAEEGISRLVEMGYIPKPIELQRDTVNGFDIRGVTVTATPVCGGLYQLRIGTGDIDVSGWNTLNVGSRTIHVWLSHDYDRCLYVGTSCDELDLSVKVPFDNVVSPVRGKVDHGTAVATIETLRDYINELHKRGELAVKKADPVITVVGEVTFTVVDVGNGEVELTVEVPDETKNYPWFNPMGEPLTPHDHGIPTMVPYDGEFELWNGARGRVFYNSRVATPMDSAKMTGVAAQHIIDFVKDAYQKYDEAVKKWAPPTNASGKIKNEWVESRRDNAGSFHAETGELAPDRRLFACGWCITDAYYPVYAPSGEYAGYIRGGEFTNATVHD